jgi:hypothetical protein
MLTEVGPETARRVVMCLEAGTTETTASPNPGTDFADTAKGRPKVTRASKSSQYKARAGNAQKLACGNYAPLSREKDFVDPVTPKEALYVEHAGE